MSTYNLSFDCNALGELFVPFEPTANSCGWNLDEGSVAYFVSQGSEYELAYPSTTIETAQPSADLVENIQAFTEIIVSLIGDNPNDQTLADDLTAWCDGIVAGGSAELMTINSTAVHIRNTAGDDKASISYVFVYCDPLGVAILLQHTINIDWAGTAEGTGNIVCNLSKSLVKFVSVYKAAFKAFGGVMALSAADVACAMLVASTVIFEVGKKLLTDSDDGGRLNFLGVLAHTLVRVSACAGPHSSPSGESPVVEAARLPAAWAQLSKNSTLDSSSTPYQAGTVFGDYPADSWEYTVNTEQTVYAQPYGMCMPELSWPQGALPVSFMTFKLTSNPSDGPEVFALTAVIYTPSGNLVCTGLQCASALKATFAVGDPAWQAYTAENVDNYSLTDYIESVIYNEMGLVDVATNQLSFVIPQQTWAVLQSIGTDIHASQPQIEVEVGREPSGSIYDTGDSPTVAVRKDGSVVECHDNRTANISSLYWNFGTVSDSSGNVEWAKTNHGTKYESGSWPAIATDPAADQCILEVHNYSSDIYLNFGSVNTSGSSVSFADDSDDSSYKIGSSDRPAVWQSPDGIVIIMYINGSSMRYQTAYYTGGDSTSCMQWHSGETDYVTGNCPTVIRDQPSNTVVEVHENDGQLWYNVGSMTANDHYKYITWGNGPYPMMINGSNPHLTCFSSGNVLLTYDNADFVYAALGRIVDHSVQWFMVNFGLFDGKWAALGAIPNHGDSAVVCYNDGSNNLASNILRPLYPSL